MLHTSHRRFCVIHFAHNFIHIFSPNCRKFSRVLELLNIHRFKQQFCQLIVKGFYKGGMGALIFHCCFSNLNIVFLKQLCHFTLKLRTIYILNYPWVLKHTTLLIDCHQMKCNFGRFFGLMGFDKFISGRNINAC